MSTAELENETETPRELNALDRCDICGAQAYVRVELSTGELLFCAHHAAEKRAAIEPIAIAWHDETSKLESPK